MSHVVLIFKLRIIHCIGHTTAHMHIHTHIDAHTQIYLISNTLNSDAIFIDDSQGNKRRDFAAIITIRPTVKHLKSFHSFP